MLGVLFERNTFSWLSTYFSLTRMLSKESSTFFFLFSVECLSLIMKCSSFQVAFDLAVNDNLGLMIRGGIEYGLGIYITGVDQQSAAFRNGLRVSFFFETF